MRYHFIQEQRDAFSLAALCRTMQVSVSGYYAWRKRPTSQRQQQNVALSAQITTVHQESKATYGSPRIYKELHEQGIACSEKRIARLMCLGWFARYIAQALCDHHQQRRGLAGCRELAGA